MKRPFGAWEAVRRVPISYWLMLWVIAEFGKLKKIGSVQPCWSRSLEGLGTLDRLDLEGLLLFMYPNYIL